MMTITDAGSGDRSDAGGYGAGAGSASGHDGNADHGATAATPVRIAMWSGPRNISTALMRSFEARGDAAVTDEPFYAA